MKLSAVITILCASAGVAHAEGYVEGVAGVAIPVSDDDYSELEEALKLGVRAGSGAPMAVEFAADYTNYQGTEALDIKFDLTRYRAMIGVRQHIAVGEKKNAALFIRGNVGADVMQFTAHSDGIIDIDESETDVGIAAELGIGGLARFGNLYLGGHLAVPFAFHFDEDDPNDDEDVDAEYTGVDIDILFTAGVRL
jgi:hypothetical protein